MSSNKSAVSGNGIGTKLKNMTDTNLLLGITIVVFFLMYIGAIVFQGAGFLKPQTFFNILNTQGGLIIVSCGMSIVMITGGIDISVGGVVAHNKNGAKITAAANAGNITVYYNNRTSTSLIGGLVAKNDRGELTYCYSTGTFTINGGVSTLDAKVGGLVAWSVNDKISNSYVNAFGAKKTM